MAKWVYILYNLKIKIMAFLKNLAKPKGTYQEWKDWLAIGNVMGRDEFLSTHFPEEYKLDNASKNR